MNNAFGQKTPPPRAASTVHFDLFDEGDVLAARPTPLVEVRPQLGVQRHSAEQVIETFVPVQVLDAPVPQMGEVQVVEFIAEVRRAGGCRAGYRSAEDPVGQDSTTYGGLFTPAADGGTVAGGADDCIFSSLQWAVEQYGDFPVPPGCGGQGGEGGLQGFSPGQGSAAYGGAEFVGIPVPGCGGGGGSCGSLQGFRPGQNSTADVEQNVDIPARGGLHGFLQSRVLPHPVVCMTLRMRILQGVFALFPFEKKCEVGSALGVGTECGLYFIHAGRLCGL